MLTEHTVAEAARTAGVPGPVHFRPTTGSTNSDLLHMAAAGAPEWTVVVAARQLAGRGRLGRTWVSPPGESVAVSILLRPPLPPAEVPALSLVAAVAMSEACRSAAGLVVGCKWPNDLICGGRKLGGVLPEARLEGGRVLFVVIGAGVNVSQRREDFPSEIRATATSIAAEGGKADASALLCSYFSGLAELYVPSRSGFLATALEQYRRRCVTLGARVRATTTKGRVVEGRAQGIGAAGELIVRTTGGEESVAFGEVEHLA